MLEVAAVVPDVSDYNGRSLEVAVVVPDVPGGSGSRCSGRSGSRRPRRQPQFAGSGRSRS